MALDWSKQITFSGLPKPKPRTREEFPSKTYMNMVVADAQERSIKRIVLITIPLIVAFLLFAKFGVYDFYARVIEKNNELSQLTFEYQMLEQQLRDYNQVLEEYRMYDAIRMTNDAADVAAIDALVLVDNYVAPQATIDSVNLSEGKLTLNLSGITLEQVGGLVSTLYQQPIVAGVQVSTAANGKQSSDANITTVTMTISLRSEAAASVGSDGTTARETVNSGEVLSEEEKTEIRQEVISTLSGNGQTYTDSATAVAEQNAQKKE